jgi:hypothetical protein
VGILEGKQNVGLLSGHVDVGQHEKNKQNKKHTHAQSTNPEAIEVTACYWSKELEARSKQEHETRGTKHQEAREARRSRERLNRESSKKQEASRAEQANC